MDRDMTEYRQEPGSGIETPPELIVDAGLVSDILACAFVLAAVVSVALGYFDATAPVKAEPAQAVPAAMPSAGNHKPLIKA